MEFTNTPAQFAFPLLKSSEILQCLSELEIELSKAELSEPQRHRDKLRKVFLLLLDVCCGLNEEDFQPTQNALDKAATMTYPELHEVSADIKFFRKLRHCMETCGIYDFSWKDIHAPNSKRLRYQLSAIINMAKLREDLLPLYGELGEPRNEYLLSLDEVNQEHDELQEQLKQVHDKYEEDSQTIERTQQENAELTKTIANLNKLQSAKRAEGQDLKNVVGGLKDELETAKWTIEEMEAEEEKLRSEVVSSPDRRKGQLKFERETLDRVRDECTNLEEKLQTTRTMCHHVEMAVKAMETEVATVESVNKEAGKFSEAGKQLEAVNQKLETQQEQVTREKEKIVFCERDLNRAEERLANLHKQNNMKMEAAQESLDAAKSRLNKVEQDRRDGMKQVQSGAARVREIETLVEEERLQTEKEIEGMISEYRETEALVLARLDERMERIGAHSHKEAY
ncbi:Kinetochore protein nuf2 [Seminavis robusta]|uniref:Kinetochore protein nuf2 n=1 Tax=Seminavis robusta TaxID=568900 RepID=A0A9N8DTV9_9STRA|nr:Kinetochore protein nuf2 [Seminavis robusta]|eukprot:Sro246_g097720.1 Kinetochore protein nuf2 (454) ;mRNA; f:43469-44974